MKRSGWGALWIALGIVVGIALLAFRTMAQLVDTVGWVVHTQDVIAVMNDLSAALAEAESSRHRFVLTGDDRQLAQFSGAVDRIGATQADIRSLTGDNPSQQRRLDEIRPLFARRLELMDAAISRRRSEGRNDERDALGVAEGAEVSERIRTILKQMVAEERRLLEERKRRAGADVTYANAGQVGGTFVSSVIVVLAFAGLRNEVLRRKRSESELRDSEENLSTTLHSIGDGVISTDVKGRVVRMNPVAERLTGWKMAEAVGRPFTEVFSIVNEITRAPAVNPIERVLREGVVVGLANHTALIAKDGSERPIADSAAPIRSGAGELTGVVLVFRDVTAERAAEVKLYETTAFLDSIVENLPDMVFVKDAKELRFERINKAGEELLGVSRNQLIGKNDFDFFPKDQAVFFQAKDREVLSQGVLLDIAEETIQTPHGQRWLHTKKIPIFDDEGRPRHLLGISDDITEKRRAAEQLKRAHDELERRVEERTRELLSTAEQLRHSQRMEAIGRLAGGIAHDFNNILSVIMSYSSMLSAELATDNPMRGDLEEIRIAGDRAAALTRQLLAFSRQQVLAPKILDLRVVVAGMEKMLRRVIGEDIELRTIASPEIDKVEVDPGQIEQVLMNLVVNARDAMPKGGTLTIEISNVQLDQAYAAEHPEVKPGDYVMLAVTDTGLGMDKATQPRVFEPFFTTKEFGKGTGLGLSTVFGIVKQSGGSIWLYSELDKGTTFKIYLPRVITASMVAANEVVRISRAEGSETVLLVEDEDQVRVLVRSILKRTGYQILEAKDGEEALHLCERFSGRIHLVLTDVVMPKVGGAQLVEKLAKIRPDTKVLFMSGYTDDTVVHHGVLHAKVAFLQKPLTPEALTRKIREVLGGPTQPA